MRLGLGQIGAEELADVAARPSDPGQHAGAAVDESVVERRRPARGAQVRIRIAGPPASRRSSRKARNADASSCADGRAEADRISEARLERGAFVCDAGREVEHVAGLEHPLALGAESRSTLSGARASSARSRCAADAPAPSPAALQQKHVVGVEMRSDTAARRGEAHHDVVHPRIRHEPERAQQAVGAGHEMIQPLDEQGPATSRHWRRRGRRDRPVLEAPPRAVADDQPRFAVRARRERERDRSPTPDRRSAATRRGRRAVASASSRPETRAARVARRAACVASAASSSMRSFEPIAGALTTGQGDGLESPRL